MANTARQLTDPNSWIDYGHVPYFDGNVIDQFTGFFRFNLTGADAAFPGSVQIRWLATLGNASFAAWQLYYYKNGGSPVLRMGYDDGLGTNGVYGSSGDPFASLSAGWHTLEWQWNGNSNTMTAAVDGPATPITMTRLGGSNLFHIKPASDSTLTIGNPPSNDLTHLGSDATSVAWTNMQVSDLAFKHGAFTSGERSLMSTGTPSPSQVVIDPALILDAGMIRGVTPETGVVPTTVSPRSSTANGSINLASIVSGPTLAPGFACAASLSPASVHVGSDSMVTISWAWQLPATSSTTFTLPDPTTASPAIPGASFTPTSVTLGTSPTATATTTLSTPLGGVATNFGAPITNGGGLPNTLLGFSTYEPAAAVSTFTVDPTGNVLILRAVTTDPLTGLPTTTPTAITNVIDGAVLHVGAKDYPLDGDWVHDSTNSFAWRGLQTRDTRTVDEADPASCALTGGGWTTVPVSSPGHQQWYDDALAKCNAGGATATYTFTGILPGRRYRIRAVQTYHDGAANWSDATTQARFTITDGTTATHLDWDQTAASPDDGGSDIGADLSTTNVLSNFHWRDIAAYTTAAGATTLTVTLTNPLGSRYLYADAVMIEVLQSPAWIRGVLDPGKPIVATGDTVTLDAPDLWLTTAAGTTGQVFGQSVTLLKDDTAVGSHPPFMEFDPATVDGSMKVGYVTGAPGQQPQTCFLYANLMESATSWFGNCTLDAAGNVTDIAPDATIVNGICQLGGDNNLDNFELISGQFGGNRGTPGTYRVTYDDGFAGATINPHLAPLAGCTIGAVNPLTGDNSTTGGTHHDFTQDVSFDPFNPTNGPGFELSVKASSGAGTRPLLNLRIFDPMTNAIVPTWTRVAHPSSVARLSRSTGIDTLRDVDFTGMNPGGLNIVSFADWPVNKVNRFVTAAITVTVTRLDPVDLSGADADEAIRYFSYDPVHGAPDAVIKVTIAESISAKKLRSGMEMSFSGLAGGVTSWPSNQNPTGAVPVPTIDLNFLGHRATIVMILGGTGGTTTGTQDDHSFLATALIGTNPNPNPGLPLTLAAPQTAGGTAFVSVGGSNGSKTPMNFIDLCDDLGTNPYFNLPPTCGTSVPPAVGDDACYGLGFYAGNNLNAGLKPHIDVANEMWNVATYAHSAWAVAMSKRLGYGSGLNYYGHLNHLFAVAFTAGWVAAGRNPDDVVRVVDIQFGAESSSAMSQIVRNEVGGRVDAIAGATYINNSPTDGVAWNGTVSAYFRLDHSGLLTTEWLYASSPWLKNGFDGMIRDIGTFSPATVPITYEGGTQSWQAEGALKPRSRIPIFHPRAYRFRLAHNQYMQSCGCRLFMRYSYDTYGQPGSTWRDFDSVLDTLGTGSWSENKNPYDLYNRASQLGGAQLAFAALTAPDPTRPTGSDAGTASDSGSVAATSSGTVLPSCFASPVFRSRIFGPAVLQ